MKGREGRVGRALGDVGRNTLLFSLNEERTLWGRSTETMVGEGWEEGEGGEDGKGLKGGEGEKSCQSTITGWYSSRFENKCSAVTRRSSKEGSYLRLVDFCITQLYAESNKEEERVGTMCGTALGRDGLGWMGGIGGEGREGRGTGGRWTKHAPLPPRTVADLLRAAHSEIATSLPKNQHRYSNNTSRNHIV